MLSSSSSRYVSETLYHFTGYGKPEDDSSNYEVLGKIIRSGRVIYKGYASRHSGIDYSLDWSASIASGELILKAVTCYCDIPRESLKIHTNKYGRLGLGFRRSFLVRNGARPVIYMPVRPKDHWDGFRPNRGRAALESWLNAWGDFTEFVAEPANGRRNLFYVQDRPRDADEAILRIESFMEKDFLPFLKSFNPDLPDEHLDNFYLEREWRLIGKLGFTKRDIAEIILPRSLVGEFQDEFPELIDRTVLLDEILD